MERAVSKKPATPETAEARYWITPPELYEKLNGKYRFNFDPAPYPRPAWFNGLWVDWGTSNYVNPPFRKKDGVGNLGPSAYVHKAIEERDKGNSSVLVLPVQNYVVTLLSAGATIEPLGRVAWREVNTGKPSPSPSPICLFHLPGVKK
jgi:hypothetical protein